MSESLPEPANLADELNRTLAQDVERMTIRPPTRRMEPLNDCVVFRAVPADRTEAGLYVPEKGAGAEARMKAVVVAVGPGKMLENGKRQKPGVKVGDHILVWKHAPSPHGSDHTGELLFVCREEDIAARIVEVP